MDSILYLVCFVALSVLAILDIANAARYFNEQKWHWFGVSVYLAVWWMIQLIRLYLKLG